MTTESLQFSKGNLTISRWNRACQTVVCVKETSSQGRGQSAQWVWGSLDHELMLLADVHNRPVKALLLLPGDDVHGHLMPSLSLPPFPSLLELSLGNSASCFFLHMKTPQEPKINISPLLCLFSHLHSMYHNYNYLMFHLKSPEKRHTEAFKTLSTWYFSEYKKIFLKH